MKFVKLSIVALTLGLFITSCGNSETPAAEAPATEETTPATEAPAAEMPAETTDSTAAPAATETPAEAPATEAAH